MSMYALTETHQTSGGFCRIEFGIQKKRCILSAGQNFESTRVSFNSHRLHFYIFYFRQSSVDIDVCCASISSG